VSIYDLATRQARCSGWRRRLPRHLAFHPRDSRLAVAPATPEWCSRRGHRRRAAPALRHPPECPTSTRSLAPGWPPVAAGCNDRKIHIWTRTRARKPCRRGWERGRCSVVAFNHAGDRLGAPTGAVCRMSGTWRPAGCCWSTPTAIGSSVRRIGCTASALRHQGQAVAAGGRPRTARASPPQSGQLWNDYRTLYPCGWPIWPPARGLTATGRGSASSTSRRGEELASAKVAVDMPVCFHASAGWLTGGRILLQWPARSDPACPEVLRVGPPRSWTRCRVLLRGWASTSADGRVLAVPDVTFTTLIHRRPRSAGFQLGRSRCSFCRREPGRPLGGNV